MKSESLILLKSSGPVQTSTGIDLALCLGTINFVYSGSLIFKKIEYQLRSCYGNIFFGSERVSTNILL